MKRNTQIFVLGMHRSGTSAVARILNIMGAYFGPEEMSLGANVENPKGFWERRDIRNINDAVLNSQGADWSHISNFNLDELTEEAKTEFELAAKPIVQELNKNSPWMLKEPRICLLYPLWQSLVDSALCIHVQRCPLEVALSLKSRNGYSLSLGVALWEKYNLLAFEYSKKSPRVLLSHQYLMTEPIAAVKQLYGDLKAFNCDDLREPSESEIESFIDPNLYRNKGDDDAVKAILNKEQLHLRDLIESGEIMNLDKLPPLSLSAAATLETFDILQDEKKKLATKVLNDAKDLEMKCLRLQKKYNKLQNESNKTILKLESLIESAQEAAIKLTRSRRWKLGNLLSLKTTQEDGSIPYAPLSNVFRRYDNFKKKNSKNH